MGLPEFLDDQKRKNLESSAPVLTEFVLGETSFQSDGFSVLKLTKGGKPLPVKLPIRSVGIVELREELERNAPKPPSKVVKILKDSEDGKRLGLEKDGFIKVFDSTDEKYLDQYSEYKTDLIWRIVMTSLQMKFVDKETHTEITEFEKKRDILKNSGITGSHLDKLITDILALVSDSESVADFLSAAVWG